MTVTVKYYNSLLIFQTPFGTMFRKKNWAGVCVIFFALVLNMESLKILNLKIVINLLEYCASQDTSMMKFLSNSQARCKTLFIVQPQTKQSSKY